MVWKFLILKENSTDKSTYNTDTEQLLTSENIDLTLIWRIIPCDSVYT